MQLIKLDLYNYFEMQLDLLSGQKSQHYRQLNQLSPLILLPLLQPIHPPFLIRSILLLLLQLPGSVELPAIYIQRVIGSQNLGVDWNARDSVIKVAWERGSASRALASSRAWRRSGVSVEPPSLPG